MFENDSVQRIYITLNEFDLYDVIWKINNADIAIKDFLIISNLSKVDFDRSISEEKDRTELEFETVERKKIKLDAIWLKNSRIEYEEKMDTSRPSGRIKFK